MFFTKKPSFVTFGDNLLWMITGKAMGTNITPFENVTLYLNQDKKLGGTGSPTTSYGFPYVWRLGEVDCYFKGFVIASLRS